ncbi:mechanosensitive ion channel family protein [Bacillus sp. AGMB 02131]|uniref:Mechanosensitive ion channel family protein n=1 Tax=Peribacillus faecalis TaxID=2772559 RepID=A0A927CZ51_9BACI|nr:mechanosensitive ion channel family protein [Peribacillus faecalis]MBD3108420.1 mechanosensitive ion channel family protein [Peribacillus faecalis]
MFESLKPFVDIDFTVITEYVISLGTTSLATYLAIKVIGYLLNQFFKRSRLLEEKKEETIKSLYKNTSNYVLAIIILIAAIKPFFADLSEVILAGGIIAAVIGFGAQKVVNDIISGIFMVFEGTIKAGDFIHLNGEIEGGTVEEIGFRITKIRLLNGKLLTISNGEIRKMVNGSVYKRRIFESVIFSFHEDPIRVKEIFINVCDELNLKHHAYLKRNEKTDEFEEKYQVYGFHSMDSSPLGYKISIVATVNDTDYITAVLEAKELLAKTIYREKIKMAETYVNVENSSQKQHLSS